MTITTNGKWASECYLVEQDGRTRWRHRLLYDDKVIVEDVPDQDDLVNLFAISLIVAGFANLAERYHKRTLYEDEANLDLVGPANTALSANDVLDLCSGGIGTMLMADEVCALLGLPNDSTFGEGVEQFRRGYQEHATLRREYPSVTAEARLVSEVGLSAEDEAFLRELERMDGDEAISTPTERTKTNWKGSGF